VTRTALVAVLVLAVACGGESGSARNGKPYVVTAIDYHFHDAHPSLPIRLDRAVQFSNQGRNRHNVTIEGTGYDRTFGPGRRITVDPIGSLLTEPGRYPFVCRLHADRGMSGVLVIVEG
jgi:plastocyanin